MSDALLQFLSDLQSGKRTAGTDELFKNAGSGRVIEGTLVASKESARHDVPRSSPEREQDQVPSME